MKGTQMLNPLNMAADLGRSLQAALPTDIIPDTDPELPPGVSGDVGTLLGWMQAVGWVVCVVALIIGGIMFGIARGRGDSSQEAVKGLAAPVGGAIIIGAAAAIIGTFAS
jgi:hypothetical protein